MLINIGSGAPFANTRGKGESSERPESAVLMPISLNRMILIEGLNWGTSTFCLGVNLFGSNSGKSVLKAKVKREHSTHVTALPIKRFSLRRLPSSCHLSLSPHEVSLIIGVLFQLIWPAHACANKLSILLRTRTLALYWSDFSSWLRAEDKRY